MSAYDVVLFQGDFITDCGRFRDNERTPNDLGALGQGYPLMAAVHLQSAMPDAGLRFFNRCISGQRIVDLYARIKADFINLQPSLISILVGVSDTWVSFPEKTGCRCQNTRGFSVSCLTRSKWNCRRSNWCFANHSF